jgi:hypothetical protein
MDHTEPWYQVVAMSHDDAKAQLFAELKHEYPDHDKLNAYIDQVVVSSVDIGSIRGYMTFLHATYKQQIIDKFKYNDDNKTTQCDQTKSEN